MGDMSWWTFLSGATFVSYGIVCLTTNHMKAEFNRYGLSRYRTLVGALELLGGCGLFLGTLIPILHFVSSGGLSLLMVLGLRARWKVKDRPLLLLPAFILLLLNLWIFFEKL
jgi:hypothetical protein